LQHSRLIPFLTAGISKFFTTLINNI
jgi:hypothetical protein